MTTEAASDLDLFEAEATGQPASKSTGTPDKYVGKSVDDLIRMHQNAEHLISRQGAEVAQVRRMADEILQLKKPITETRPIAREPVTVQTLLNDPEKALQSAVDSSSVAQRATQADTRIAQLESSIAETRFTSKHANFAEDLNDPAFIAWINKSPVRAALGQAVAAKNFDAATNLWDLWTEHKELSGTTQNVAITKAKTVPSGVKSAPAQPRGKPIFSRAKLMELRMKVQQGDTAATARYNDPAFQDRMHEAYAEDRVR